MKYLEILPHLRKLKVFSVNDIQIIDDRYTSYKVSSWVKKGYIYPITRGYYILEEYKNDPSIANIIANRIYSPSYISLESALSKYGIIPEYPFTTTSVSTKKTTQIQTDFRNFSYHTVKTDLYWGYNICGTGKEKYLIASLEKAIIDFFYLRTKYTDGDDLSGLRWNREELQNKLNRATLKKYVKIIDSTTLNKKIHTLINYIEKG